MAKNYSKPSTPTRSKVIKQKTFTIDVIKLPVFVLLFWLLVMGPFFTQMTKIENGQVVLADEFTFTEIDIPGDQTPYNIQYIQNSVYAGDTDNFFTNSSYNRTNKIDIINNSIFFINYEFITVILFWDENDNYLGIYGDDPTDFFKDAGVYLGNRPNEWNNSFIPSNASKFAFQSQSGTLFDYFPRNIPFATFQTIEAESRTSSIIAVDYYQIMENARTTEYANPFGFMIFILELPQIIGEFKPLQFVGVDNTVGEITNTINGIRARVSPYNFLQYLNPVNWRRSD